MNDSRIKLTDEELKNRDKQFKNILAEYQKVKKRLEQVSDGSYVHDLKAKLAQQEAEIKKNERTIKELEMEQKKRERYMERLIREEKPEKMRNVEYNNARLGYLQDKANGLREKIDQIRRQQADLDTKTDEVKGKYRKAVEVAERYGVDPHDLDRKEESAINRKAEELEKKRRILKGTIEALSKTLKAEVDDKRKAFKGLVETRRSVESSIRDKVDDIRRKAEELQGLITKARKGGDVQNTDLLTRWEEEIYELLERIEADMESLLDVDAKRDESIMATPAERDLKLIPSPRAVGSDNEEGGAQKRLPFGVAPQPPKRPVPQQSEKKPSHPPPKKSPSPTKKPVETSLEPREPPRNDQNKSEAGGSVAKKEPASKQSSKPFGFGKKREDVPAAAPESKKVVELKKESPPPEPSPRKDPPPAPK